MVDKHNQCEERRMRDAHRRTKHAKKTTNQTKEQIKTNLWKANETAKQKNDKTMTRAGRFGDAYCPAKGPLVKRFVNTAKERQPNSGRLLRTRRRLLGKASPRWTLNHVCGIYTKDNWKKIPFVMLTLRTSTSSSFCFTT